MPSARRNIQAVCVNHNTSAYVELMLRSLAATHGRIEELGIALTVLDNASDDDTSALRVYAADAGVPVLPSGMPVRTQYNSHGDALRRFVLEHPACTHYLLLDADIVFVEEDTLGTMAEELEAAPEEVFAIGARMGQPWNGAEIPADLRDAFYERRLHPFCALIRQTETFRRVVQEIGLAVSYILQADHAQYLCTGELMTKVMRTHGLRHIRSSATVLHFMAVSYDMYGKKHLEARAQERDGLLQALRERRSSAAAAR